ncbi:hypothetical protein BC832DRAFT_559990 [Gaertneriomyces semiglobifer]|nr:hypothetical protein BC832DRAFT_559990 [Gaertneriomyces semiglobifer]
MSSTPIKLAKRKRPPSSPAATAPVYHPDFALQPESEEPQAKRLRNVDAVKWRSASFKDAGDNQSPGSAREDQWPIETSTGAVHNDAQEPKKDSFLDKFFNENQNEMGIAPLHESTSKGCESGNQPGANSSLFFESTCSTPNGDQEDSDSDDSFSDEEFEEIPIFLPTDSLEPVLDTSTPSESPASSFFTITLPRAPTKDEEANARKTKGITSQHRLVRSLLHKAHLMCLLYAGILRNQWCNDKEVQCVAVSVLPDDIYKGIVKCIGKGEKEGRGKGNYLKHYLGLMVKWWYNTFRSKSEATPIGENDSQTLNENLVGPQRIVNELRQFMEGEIQFLEREVCVLLFVAACRAVGIDGVRLVAALHPIPLSLKKDKNGVKAGENYPLEYFVEISVPSSSTTQLEVVSLHPLHNLLSPSPSRTPISSISYIIAYDPFSNLKDVTRRYTAQFHLTSKLRVRDTDWLERTLWLFTKSTESQTEHDRNEEHGLKRNEMNEAMPTSIAAFLNHPLYVLERHLKKHEALDPESRIVGRFKGEKVYDRHNVREVCSREAWTRKGRKVKEGEAPVKYGKVRGTVTRMRGIEEEKRMRDQRQDVENYQSQEGDVEVDPSMDSSLSPLFAEWQTEIYPRPSLTEAGRIPRNTFGNIEIFHPNMVPLSCVHLALPHLPPVLKLLNIEYVPAVTRFEYNQGRGRPVVEGVVIREDLEGLVREAWEEWMGVKRENERRKRWDRVAARWRKVVKGVLVRERVRMEYGGDSDDDGDEKLQ